MKAHPLKTQILASFLAVIAILAVMIGVLGYYVIQRQIIGRVQTEVSRYLGSARWFYAGEIERIGEGIRLAGVTGKEDMSSLRDRLHLHYVVAEPVNDPNALGSEIARAAVLRGREAGGTRLVPLEQLPMLGPDLARGRVVQIKQTPRARPTAKTTLDVVMVKEYAMPIRDGQGRITRVVYGGRIINQDFEFVDRIRDLAFGNGLYKDKPIGTVTIFQDDVRIATNVLDESAQRAVGTRVSEQVYKRVVEDGQTWRDRAFVVTDWYMTAYEPIRDIEGRIIGILYVGILERPLSDMETRILWVFLAIVAGATVFAVGIAYVLVVSISKPLTQVVHATECLASGDWGCQVSATTSVAELNSLAEAFNALAVGLKDREESLRIYNEKLVAANKSYVDLIGFVAHELKGILASAVMNIYSVRDGFLGMINFKQRKAIDSVARNLDYLTSVVRKFLNLGRIERGDLTLSKTKVKMRDDVFQMSIEAMTTLAKRKGLRIDNQIDPTMEVQVDLDLMQIVANNLVSNAIKYSSGGGRVEIRSKTIEGQVRIEVYNDSAPIGPEQKEHLFKKFSRLDNAQTKKEKGTGLGLYITKQIVDAHGGRVWVEARDQGNAFIFQIERG